MSGLPVLFGASGPIATPPATLQAALIALVATMAPGYTATLPGSLIEDISSTDVGALVTIDQARVEAISNVTPYGANAYVLAQLGAMFGISQGTAANGSVYVVFTGSPGYVIPPGFVVGDGTNQYSIQDGGAIGVGGTSASLYAVATQAGTFAIPVGSVNVVVTSVPSPYTLSVTNALAGTPATAAQTVESYRAQVIEAFSVSLSGSATYIKTLLQQVPGVNARLIAVHQVTGGWEVICGGGDPYQVAAAVYQGISTPSLLVGSATSIRNVTVSIYDAPDTYTITFVNPPQQVVTVAVVWNTTLTGFTASASVNQYIITAASSYINSIVVGQPINILVLQETIQTAIASVLAPVNLTTLQFTITINGTVAIPTAGTSIISSDPESYFFVSATGCTSVQG